VPRRARAAPATRDATSRQMALLGESSGEGDLRERSTGQQQELLRLGDARPELPLVWRDACRGLERTAELRLGQPNQRREVAEEHCLREVLHDVLGDPAELRWGQPSFRTLGAPRGHPQEVDLHAQSVRLSMYRLLYASGASHSAARHLASERSRSLENTRGAGIESCSPIASETTEVCNSCWRPARPGQQTRSAAEAVLVDPQRADLRFERRTRHAQTSGSSRWTEYATTSDAQRLLDGRFLVGGDRIG
jgi:hypothetical protein